MSYIQDTESLVPNVWLSGIQANAGLWSHNRGAHCILGDQLGENVSGNVRGSEGEIGQGGEVIQRAGVRELSSSQDPETELPT